MNKFNPDDGVNIGIFLFIEYGVTKLFVIESTTEFGLIIVESIFKSIMVKDECALTKSFITTISKHYLMWRIFFQLSLKSFFCSRTT